MIVGVSGDFDNLTGFLKAIDPETGKTQWRWDSTPPAGTPNATTGGMTWMTGTYDPDLNLLYWGTGNPTPVLNGKRGRATIFIPAASSLSIPIPANSSGRFNRLRMTRTIGMRSRPPCWSMETFARPTAENADADFAQRLFFRAGSH